MHTERRPSPPARPPIGSAASVAKPSPGDYFCDETSLYRVEWLRGDRIVIENCLSEQLVDISLPELGELRKLDRSAD